MLVGTGPLKQTGRVTMLSQRILILDDDKEIGELVWSAADGQGLECIVTTDADSFFLALTPDVTSIFLDLVMPDIDGVEILRMLGEQRCRAGIIMMSGIGKRIIESAESLAATLGLSIVDHLVKPFSIAQLENILNRSRKPEIAHSARSHVDNPFDAGELARAVDQQEFILHYQPQIEIATGKCLGVEALVRWQRPGFGLVAPDAFIEFAEELDLIDDLTWLIMRRGMSEMGDVRGGDGEPLSLSFNVSVLSLRHLTFPDNLVAIASEYGVAPERLILEVTETGLIRDLSKTLDVLTRLRMRKVRLSIDDFGTGYAMMQQLRLIPANELKIDKSMVDHLDSESQRVVVQKMIELTSALDMVSVAEGVETPEQLEFLRAKSCDIAQGYLFSRALPKEEFLSWRESYEASSTIRGNGRQC
jgi:EAL domain-containing protein (putative c-di-GMP-specific phosphodiesterase class I)/FixJ family two-component response regulator